MSNQIGTMRAVLYFEPVQDHCQIAYYSEFNHTIQSPGKIDIDSLVYGFYDIPSNINPLGMHESTLARYAQKRELEAK